MAIAMSPRNATNLVTRGYVLAFAGQHEEGLTLVERACKVEPLLSPSYISCLGDCLYLTKQFEKANDAYQRVLDNSFMFKLNRAACYFHLDRIDEARQIMKYKPLQFDAHVYAANSARMCALPEDRELIFEGFSGAAAVAPLSP